MNSTTFRAFGRSFDIKAGLVEAYLALAELSKAITVRALNKRKGLFEPKYKFENDILWHGNRAVNKRSNWLSEEMILTKRQTEKLKLDASMKSVLSFLESCIDDSAYECMDLIKNSHDKYYNDILDVLNATGFLKKDDLMQITIRFGAVYLG